MVHKKNYNGGKGVGSNWLAWRGPVKTHGLLIAAQVSDFWVSIFRHDQKCVSDFVTTHRDTLQRLRASADAQLNQDVLPTQVPVFSPSSLGTTTENLPSAQYNNVIPSVFPNNQPPKANLLVITPQQQIKQNELIDHLLKADLDAAKQSELGGASFLYPNKEGLFPLVAAVYGTNLEAVRYIEKKLKQEEAILQWSGVNVEKAKREIASEMPKELRISCNIW